MKMLYDIIAGIISMIAKSLGVSYATANVAWSLYLQGLVCILSLASHSHEEEIQAIRPGCVHHIRNSLHSWICIPDIRQLVQFHQPIHWAEFSDSA